MMRKAWQWLGTLILAGLPVLLQAQEPVRVAAASDLQFALEAVAQRFQERTDHQVRLTFGSSGNLHRQIAQGAPFDLFLSADEAYVRELYRQGHAQDEGVRYARGRLVWLQPAGRDDLPGEESPLAKVESAIEAYRVSQTRSRIALANPEHAPYGVAARQVLERMRLWQMAQPLLVMGENVTQAAQFALSGDAEGGLVAYSLALAPPIAERSQYQLIPQGWHPPLYQRMALLEGAGEDASAFYEFLQQQEAREILADFGFQLPDEASGDKAL